MAINENSIIRVRIPRDLYESAKAELMLEAKRAQQYGAGMTPVDKPKASKKPANATKAAGAASDKPEASKKPAGAASDKKPANAPVKVHKGESPGDNIPNADKDIPGMGLTEKKELGLEELKQLAELLGSHIAKLEEKAAKKEEKAPVEEKKEADHE